MTQRIKIGSKEYELNASAWTLLKYKEIFHRNWYNDLNANIQEELKAQKFNQKYSKLTDEDFNKLPKEEQEQYWKTLNDLNIDIEFILNTIYAMTVAGGFNGTMQELLSKIPAKDLDPNSDFMKKISKLIAEFTPETKKKQ
jgi:hypothetical protein